MNTKKIKKNLKHIYNNTMQCNNSRPTCSYLMHTVQNKWDFKFTCLCKMYLVYCMFSKFSYLRIIPFVRNKMIEAAGGIKKCMKEPRSQLISTSRQWWNIQCISEIVIVLVRKTVLTYKGKARFPLAELTARVNGWPVSITCQHGPCWRIMETGHPSTQAVNSGSGNRA